LVCGRDSLSYGELKEQPMLYSLLQKPATVGPVHIFPVRVLASYLMRFCREAWQ